MRLMLMMLACLAHWRRGVAADAHDAGLSGWLGQNGVRLMLMMVARPAGCTENGVLMLMMLACPAGWRG